MKLEVLRISSGPDSTSGILFIVDDMADSPHSEGFRCKRSFVCYTLEDEHRDEKNMEKQESLLGHIKLNLEQKVDIIKNILKDFLRFIGVCFILLTYLTLNIF